MVTFRRVRHIHYEIEFHHFVDSCRYSPAANFSGLVLNNNKHLADPSPPQQDACSLSDYSKFLPLASLTVMQQIILAINCSNIMISSHCLMNRSNYNKHIFTNLGPQLQISTSFLISEIFLTNSMTKMAVKTKTT